MGDTRRRGVNDREIEDELDVSDLELDPYASSDIEDEDYVPHGGNYNYRSSESDSSLTSSEEDNEEPPEAQPILRRGRGRGRGNRRRLARRVISPVRQESVSAWKEIQFTPPSIPHTAPTYLPVNTEKFQKHDYFFQYFDTELLELIVERTNQMSIFKTGKSLNLTLSELNIFIGASMVMSTIGYPQMRMYWQNKYRVPIIAEQISRNRFFLLKNHLKIVFDPAVSSEQRSKDKLWKVRPLVNKIVNVCQKQMRDKSMCIDEMIIPFSGRCGIKQYCPNKPNPVGLKAFVLANPNGIICDFFIYQGKTSFEEYEYTNFNLAEKVVLKLSMDLQPGHLLYFDRYFTTERLVQELKDKDILCAGTVSKNRIPKDVKTQLKTIEKELKREGRGSCKVLVNENTNIATVVWLDNSPVTLMSSAHANNTSDECQRWCKKEKKFITVTRPEVVKIYNSNMGGVDLADRMLAVCPFRYRTRKWTQRLFAHMMDLATSNAWLQYRQDQLAKGVLIKRIQQIRAFKLELGELLIESAIETDQEQTSCSDDEPHTSRKRGRQYIVQMPREAKRKRGAKHMPALSVNQNICRLQGCTKKTKMICSNCNIHLCVTLNRNCFTQFHS